MSEIWYLLPSELTLEWWNYLSDFNKQIVRTLPNFNEEKFIRIIEVMEKARIKED
jgi:hypothetical protein